MTKSEEVDQIFSALVKVQSELQGAKKDSKNPFFSSSYADLESCWEAGRGLLTKNNLCVAQMGGFENGESGLYTVLGHSSGQWIKGFLPMKIVKASVKTGGPEVETPQGQGSALTYLRRYGFASMIGLVQIDDDGEAAMGRGRIYPEQPAPGDGHSVDKGYVIDFGKWNKRTLEEVMRNEGPEVIRNYIDFLEESAIKKNQPIDPAGKAGIFVQQASDFLAAFENGGVSA